MALREGDFATQETCDNIWDILGVQNLGGQRGGWSEFGVVGGNGT